MNQIDLYVQNYFMMTRTPFVTEFLYVITTFFDVTDSVSLIRFLILILCVGVLIYLIRNLKFSFIFISSLLFGAIVTYLLKYFFDVSRPIDGIMFVAGKSFPSYHATISTVFFGMLMYIFDSHMGMTKRVIFNLFCVISIILVSVSRLYLGVHWLSDVLGGIGLGVVICFISIKVFKYFK